MSIAYDEGVIACDQFFERLTGQKFADYVREQLPLIFSKSANVVGKHFLQDSDPVQNNAAAKRAFRQVDAMMFSIPARSPDLNPIENLFYLMSRQLEKDALDIDITSENFEQFSARLKKTMKHFPITTTDNIIKSMGNGAATIIKKRGERLRYNKNI